MKLRDYQRAARKTDQFARRRARGVDGTPDRGELIPLLGLTGEVGALLAEYKKLLRDGPVHVNFKERLAEELGDTLWYISTVASRFGLSLDEIAEANLEKVRDRWSKPKRRAPLDADFPPKERLPLKFTYRFAYGRRPDGDLGVSLTDASGNQVGNLLTDNAHRDDGYRFHDVMHFAFVALLGWSPVARAILGRKRRSKKSANEVEDGGRASVIDEAIVAMVFNYIGHDLAATRGMARVDTETLRGVRALTRGFEVHARTEAEWEDAILKGLRVWREVELHDGGSITGDYKRGTLTFIPPGRRVRAQSGGGAKNARSHRGARST